MVDSEEIEVSNSSPKTSTKEADTNYASLQQIGNSKTVVKKKAKTQIFPKQTFSIDVKNDNIVNDKVIRAMGVTDPEEFETARIFYANNISHL